MGWGSPDVLGPPRGQTPARLPLHRLSRCLPNLYIRPPRRRHQGHPTSGESYVPGSLVEHYLTRRSRGSSKPPAPEEETSDPDEGLEEIVVDEVPPEFRESPAAVPAQEEERDENGRYAYHPSFIDPPVDESELDEDGLTEQDRADLAVLRETYDRIARRWQALSPRARNKRLLELAQGGTIPLAGLAHISAATQAEPAAKGRGKRPRCLPGDLRPSAVTTRSDPKYQQDLDAGLTSQDAFKRHKSRFRALLHAMKSGRDIPTTPARQGRTTGELPPLQSRGRRHKEEML